MKAYEDVDAEDPRYGDGCLAMIVGIILCIAVIAGCIGMIFGK
jgi:hypothetical protein